MGDGSSKARSHPAEPSSRQCLNALHFMEEQPWEQTEAITPPRAIPLQAEQLLSSSPAPFGPHTPAAPLPSQTLPGSESQEFVPGIFMIPGTQTRAQSSREGGSMQQPPLLPWPPTSLQGGCQVAPARAWGSPCSSIRIFLQDLSLPYPCSVHLLVHRNPTAFCKPPTTP